jgi:hypothetical protein
MNPYAPASPVIEQVPESTTAKSEFEPTSSLIIDMTIIGVYLTGLYRVSIHYQAYYLAGNGSAFFSQLANDFSVLGAVVILAVALFSDQPTKYSRHIRFLSFLVCVAFAFHFPSGKFTYDTLLRGTALAMAIFPMLLFGYSIPHGCLRAWQRIRVDTTR